MALHYIQIGHFVSEKQSFLNRFLLLLPASSLIVNPMLRNICYRIIYVESDEFAKINGECVVAPYV